MAAETIAKGAPADSTTATGRRKEAVARVRLTPGEGAITVNEKSQEPGTWETILRRVAPALAGTASTALVERVTRAPDDGRDSAAPQAD